MAGWLNVIVPVFYHLFGPLPGNGLVWTPPNGTDAFGFPTAFTANTKEFNFGNELPFIERAEWLVVWQPVSGMLAKLRFHQTLPDFVDLVEIDPSTNPGISGGPISSRADVTSQIRFLAAQKSSGYVSHAFSGNGQLQTLYESVLLIDYRVGYYGDLNDL